MTRVLQEDYYLLQTLSWNRWKHTTKGGVTGAICAPESKRSHGCGPLPPDMHF